MYVIITTCDPKDAKIILRELLERRLVGCGNITVGISSMYWWDGEIQDDEEATLFMETTDVQRDKAMEALNKIHPYETPKILSWRVEGSLNYLRWLQEVTSS